MNLVYLAQIIGTVAIFLLFVIKFYIAVDLKSFRQAGRPAILWTTMYVFELFILRILTLFNIGSNDEIKVISGFSALIPLGAVIIHLWLNKKMDEHQNEDNK